MDARHGADVERRIVSVLFADLVGFTPLAERLDAEDVAAIQDAYFAAVRETVARYGGRLEKFIGDAAMAVFGVPRTREDDAERAVRAGLAIVGAVEALGGRLGLESNELRVRVGVNSGEAVAALGGPDEGRVTGDTVNTAARLQAAAPAGAVLVGEATALAVAATIELEPLEQPLALKGKAQSVHAQVARGIRAEWSREAAMGELRAPLIGREAAFAHLTAIADRAASPQGAEALLLLAPPGVGKTRLVEEFVAARPSATVLRARVRADAAGSFEPITQLLAAGYGPPADSVEAERRGLVEALEHAGSGPARAAVIAADVLALLHPAAIRTGGAPDQDAIFEAWASALDAIAPEGPAIWVLEDLHWAGPDLLEFLDAAARRPRAGGRLILASARPSILERLDGDESGARARAWIRMELPPLATVAASELITALVGDALPPSLVERIVESSDGNCLFIEELLRTWVGVGTLVRDGSAPRWRLTVAPEDAPLPSTVQAIYAAQIDDLPAEARAAARRASVAGRRFPVDALGALGVPDGEASLGPLQRRSLISGPFDDRHTGEAYAYRHALLRDAGYASLARAERARLHLRLGRWLEQTAGSRASEVADAVARHYDAALSSAPALAADVGDGVTRTEVSQLAATWYERAGDVAHDQYANEAARAAYRRSIDRSGDAEASDLARRWQRLGEANARGGSLDEAADAFRVACDRYARIVDATDAPADRLAAARRGLAEATAALASVRYEQLRFAESRDLAEAALAKIGHDDAIAAVPLLLARLRGLEGLTNDYAALHAQAGEVLALARTTGDPDLVLAARRAILAFGHSAGITQPEDWLQFAAQSEARGRPADAVRALINAAALMLDVDTGRAAALADRAETLAAARGLAESLGWIHHLRTELALQSGDWRTGREAGRAGLDLAGARGYDRIAVRTWFALVPIAAATGDTALGEEAAAWFEVRAGRFPPSPYGRINHTAVDLRLADLGVMPLPALDPDGLLPGFAIPDASASWLSGIERIVEGWLREGRVDVAGEARRRFVAVEQPATPLLRSSHALVTGMVDRAAGHSDAARAAAHQAVAAAREASAPWWLSRAIRLLASSGAVDPALLAEADAIETRLGIVSAPQVG